jgi:CheY-like chemotaxis protein
VPGLHAVTRLNLFIRPLLTGFATSRVYPVGMAHVVIADEDYGVLYLLAILINRLGWTSDMAVNGIEAWDKVRQQGPDLVMAEMDLPGMSGLDLVGAIQGHPPLEHIPAVLMGQAGNEAAARAAGCAAYLTKPFGGQTVLRLLPQLLPQEPSD